MSCSGTSEIFDDVYDEAKAPPKIDVNDDLGYNDYIKSQEDLYEVEVDTNRYYKRSLGGVNPSYYDNGISRYSGTPATRGGYGYYPSGNSYGGSPYNQYSWSNFSTGMCQFSCITYFKHGSCRHTQNSNGFYAFGYIYHDPYMNCDPYGFGSSYYYNGGGYYGYYNNYGYNNYYNNCYGYNNYGYNNGYYGYNNGYYNGYYGGYGYPYYGGPFGWYGNGGNNWGNWNNNSNDVAEYADNHYHGHRGGTNSGSNSQNNTNYEHTVKDQIQVPTSPFPVYTASVNSVSSGQNTVANTAFANSDNSSNITDINTVHTSNTVSNSNSKPVYSDNNGSHVKPVQSTNYVSNNTVQPVPSNVSSKPLIIKGKPAYNQFATSNSKTTSYKPTTIQGNNSNNTSNQTTYASPNKYGQGVRDENKPKPSYYYGATNNTTTTNSNNRRTNSSNTGGTYNSGSSNRTYNSGNSSSHRTTSSNRSSSSSTTRSSGSSGSSGSTKSGTSRRR
jgi:hypothetical protein